MEAEAKARTDGAGANSAAGAASSSAAAAASSSSAAVAAVACSPTPPLVSYSFARCAHCCYPTVLPPVHSCDVSLRRLLELHTSPLVWPLSRVLSLQLHLNAESAVNVRTAAYLTKLEEFRTISRTLPSSGSQQQQQQALHYQQHNQQQQHLQQQRRSGGGGSGGAQSEDGKSQHEECSPPSSSVSSTSSAAPASRVEQQLLHSRDQLLQCMEMRDRIEATAAAAAAAGGCGATTAAEDDPLTPVMRHPEFTPTHFRIMQMLLLDEPTHSAAAPLTASSSAAALSATPLLSSTLLSLVARFLADRSSLLAERAQVEAAWRVLQTVRDVQAQQQQQQQQQPQQQPAPGVPGLGSLTVDVLLNLFECRFQKQRLILELRTEPFQSLLLSKVAELMLRLYDALVLVLVAKEPPPLPQRLAHLATTLPPPPALTAPSAVHAAWRHTVQQARAVEHAQNTPASFRNMDLRALTQPQQRAVDPSLQRLSAADLRMCAECCRLLYCDVRTTIAMQPHVAVDAPQARPLRSPAHPAAVAGDAPAVVAIVAAAAASAAAAAAPTTSSSPHSDPLLHDDDDSASILTPPAATPAAAQVTPRPKAAHAKKSNKHGQQHAHQHQQQQQRHQQPQTSSGSGGKFPNAVFRRERAHPYHTTR